MSDRLKPIDLNNTDITLILTRQQLIIMMIEEGKLDPAQGLDLYENQFREDIILEERQACMNPNSILREDSPLGRLWTVYLKTKRNPKLAENFRDNELPLEENT